MKYQISFHRVDADGDSQLSTYHENEYQTAKDRFDMECHIQEKYRKYFEGTTRIFLKKANNGKWIILQHKQLTHDS